MNLARTTPIDAVLFDLDGTLIDSKGLYIAAYQEAVEPYIRQDMTEEKILALRPTSEIEFMRAIVAAEDFDTALDGFYQSYADLHADCFDGVFPGVHQLLGSLRQARLPIGLVTGKSRRSWEITRAALDALEPFDVLVFDDDVRAPKPDPHGLEIALRALAIEPGRAAYVGDTLSDMEAAQAAGLQPIAALWSFDEDRRMRHLERIRPTGATAISRPTDLLDLLGL